MSVGDRIATPDGKQRYVRSLFATIADRYDLITRLFSYGQDGRWKRRLVRMSGAWPGARVLDLATGTGDIAYLLHDAGAHVVGLDLTPRMVALANEKRPPSARPRFLVGDMLALPFPDGSFDIVTTGYGLRNVPDLALAMTEIVRVLAPRGRLLSLDFARPENAAIRHAYLGYLWLVGGVVGWLLHRDADTYRYIPASIRRYPGSTVIVALLGERGFRRARYHRVLGGLMAIHEAEK